MSDDTETPSDQGDRDGRRPIKGTLLRPRKLPGETREEAARRIAKKLVKQLRGFRDADDQRD